MEKVPFNWEMCWGSQPEVYPDPGDDRYCQRYAATLYDDDLREAVFPAVDAVTVHDPLRPELTAVTVRRVPGLPDTAWWSGPGTLRMEVCLSAWWPLEVRDRLWSQVDGLLALDVLAWDLERAVPREMFLLDWTDDPTIRLPDDDDDDLEDWRHDIGAPVAPVLVRAEVTGTGQPTDPWHIFTELERVVQDGQPGGPTPDPPDSRVTELSPFLHARRAGWPAIGGEGPVAAGRGAQAAEGAGVWGEWVVETGCGWRRRG
jgi:hypothetical protein